MEGQYHNYEQRIEEAKTRLPQELWGVAIFRDLNGRVNPYALKLVNEQFKRLKSEPTAIVRCTGVFRTTMGLPCAHEIQTRWYDRAGGGLLKLEDIHPHWHFVKPPRPRLMTAEQEQEQNNHTMGGNSLDDATIIPGTPSIVSPSPSPQPLPSPPPTDDSDLPYDLLRVNEPAIVRPKGRPKGAPNKAWAPPKLTQAQKRLQQQYENSTRRALSAFELTPDLPSSQVPDSQPSQSQRGRGGRGGRGREGRGSRGGRGRGGFTGDAGSSQIEGVPASYMGAFQL